MSVCTIILCPEDSHQIKDVVCLLTEAGVTVDSTDPDNGVIECTGESELMRSLEKSHLFEYVRVLFTYVCHSDCAEDTDSEM